MEVKAVIFDCDGTLVDTEFLSAKAYTESLKLYGITYDPHDLLNEFMGVANIDITEALARRFGKAMNFDDLRDEYIRAMSREMGTLMRVFEDSVAFVRDLVAEGYKVAVASNGTHEVVIEELERAGYLEFISRDLVFAPSDTRAPKPAPDLPLAAAKALGVDPAECVFVEDTTTGGRAGIAAGMRVVGYTGLAHAPDTQRQALENAGISRIISHMPQLRLHLG